MLGFYQLSSRPDGLRKLECSQLANSEAAKAFLQDVMLGEYLISVVPDNSGSSEINRKPGAKWILIVPFFEECSQDVSHWALSRTRWTRRKLYVEVDGNRLILPWDTRSPGLKPWRQRGNIDGESYRVLWRVR